MPIAPVLIDGAWRSGVAAEVFHAFDPTRSEPLDEYPVSSWDEIDQALEAASAAYRSRANPADIARFLDRYADRLDARAGEIVAEAHRETGLAATPRLADIELPRTTDQLRQAAASARERSWVRPRVSPGARVASMLSPIPGVVVVFGPNNFPLAFNAVSGGDFAAAVATGHPVIAKANPGHPGTTRLLAEEAAAAVTESGIHRATVQMVYRTSHEDGLRLVADRRVAATGYTGARGPGLALKASADAAGVPIYLELSSVNPTVVLPGAWRERGGEIARELAASMLLGCGQFCTSPGLVLTPGGPHAAPLRSELARRVGSEPSGTLLARSVVAGLEAVKASWEAVGAEVVAEAGSRGQGLSFPNTLMHVDGQRFLSDRETLQREAFGNLSLIVEAADVEELAAILAGLEGNLTGSIYAASDGSDDAAYTLLEPILRERVGRLLNDKAPTGVAVTGAMNHGGPYPATGHPGFTAVGIPASLERFGMLACYDNVRDDRLPPELQASNPLGLQRCVDGVWTRQPVVWGG